MDDSNDPPPSAGVNETDRVGLPEKRLETDDVFEALTHERRRYLLYTLFEDETWSLEEIATKLAAWEHRVPEDAVDREAVEEAYASLYHAHVPKLVDFGIVEFDRREETITRGPRAKPTLDVLGNTGASDSAEIERHARGDDNDG